MILPFIWGYKMHRISKAHLQNPKELGGLALPTFRQYYWAAKMSAMMFWRERDQMSADQLDILYIPNGFI